MYMSPPIGVLAILAVGLASTAWIATPQREVTQVSVILPTATHQKLVLWGKEHIGEEGRPLTVVQVIEELANKWEKKTRPSRISPTPR